MLTTRFFELRQLLMGTESSDGDHSNLMNPNNDAYWDSLDNHADQMNPNNDEYGGHDDD